MRAPLPSTDSLAPVPPTAGRMRARTEAEVTQALAALDELAAWEVRHRHTPRLSAVVNAIRRARADLRATQRRARVPPPWASYYALYRCVRATWQQDPQWRRHLIAKADRPLLSRSAQWWVVLTLCGAKEEVPENYVPGSAFARRRPSWRSDIQVGDVVVGLLDRTPIGVISTCLRCEGRWSTEETQS